ncbi:MAG TPA: phosphate signaling complex protein PhoU [Chloroflexi bacterium]|nr:MAG: phosphate transport system regulatory protein PhoU [Chloroflexota bacterium]HDN04475.1 phosphate signaling complex protein PhoU [Chloroflexota bacterium]
MARDTRETLDTKIRELNDAIIELASIVEQAILGSVTALAERDITSAKAIYEGDKTINEKRFELERQALIIVATQQPMATDLRRLSSIIDIAGELERIGDYAKGIARIAMRLGDHTPLRQLVNIPKMAEMTADMLHRAISAFVSLDEEAGMSIPKEDDQIDVLYNLDYQELLELMINDRDNIDRATFHLWVAHNLERAADRVTNICERTVFTTTGKLIEFDRTDDESDAF